MASVTFFAIDSSNLMVDSSPNAAIVGNPVINNSDTPDGTVFTFTSGGGTNITLDDTGGSVDTFEDDNAAAHVITDGGGIVANGNTVEAESLIFVQALDAGGTPTGPVITLTVFSQNGVTGDVWGFASDVPLQNGVSYVKTGGSNIGSSDYADFLACFGPGTKIKTPYGEQDVETIRSGQLVWTLDQGYMPVSWAGTTTVCGRGAFAPVVFAPGTIDNPTELTVSQEHRIFLRSSKAELLFGSAEVLIAAKHLCGLPGISLKSQPVINYTHFMFDSHQIITSNGALTESFFLSENAVSSVNRDQQRELRALFPSLTQGMQDFGATAARTLKANEAAVLRAYLN